MRYGRLWKKHIPLLIREHTKAEGFPDCDFRYLMGNDPNGDPVKVFRLAGGNEADQS